MTEAEFVGMLPAIKGKARRFKALFHSAVGEDDLFQAGATAAWESAVTADDRPTSPLPIFCRKRAGWAMVDLFRRELVRGAAGGRNVLDAVGELALRLLVEPTDVLERRIDAMRVCRAIDGLPPDQREVMRRLYADGQGQAEAGAAMGVTQSRVSQIKSQAIAAIRRELSITA